MSRWEIIKTGAMLSEQIGVATNPDGSERSIVRGFIGVAGQVIEGDLDPHFVERYESGEAHARSLVIRLDDAETIRALVDAGEQAPEYDPSDHTVDEVAAYLADASEEEVDRVILVEIEGKGRKKIVEWGD